MAKMYYTEHEGGFIKELPIKCRRSLIIRNMKRYRRPAEMAVGDDHTVTECLSFLPSKKGHIQVHSLFIGCKTGGDGAFLSAKRIWDNCFFGYRPELGQRVVTRSSVLRKKRARSKEYCQTVKLIWDLKSGQPDDRPKV